MWLELAKTDRFVQDGRGEGSLMVFPFTIWDYLGPGITCFLVELLGLSCSDQARVFSGSFFFTLIRLPIRGRACTRYFPSLLRRLLGRELRQKRLDKSSRAKRRRVEKKTDFFLFLLQLQIHPRRTSSDPAIAVVK